MALFFVLGLAIYTRDCLNGINVANLLIEKQRV